MCVGLGLIFGVMRVINFAQGEFLMLGMYRHALRRDRARPAALLGPYAGPFVGAVLAGPVLFVGGYLLHRYLVSRVTGIRAIGAEGEGHYAQLILTLGIALILQNGGLILFGSTPQSVRTPLSASAWEIGCRSRRCGRVRQQGARARRARVSVAVTAGAVSGSSPLAARQGVARGGRQSRGRRPTWGSTSIARTASRSASAPAITAVAGGLVATYYPFQPYVGLEFVIIMYAGVVLGGMGSILGAFWGGMTIGLVQQLSALVLPLQLQNVAIFVVFLLIVLFRPQGLFGRSVERT